MAKKQAIVLIHGIGEQVPMDTLRGFVKAVWTTDKSARRPKVPETAWSKPDRISGNFELRRLTTAENCDGKRTDFFEFYWAHLMQGTTLSAVGAWAKVLVFRWPWRVPRQLRGFWFLLVGLLILGLLTALNQAFKWVEIPGLVTIAGSIAWVFVIKSLLVNVVGDAARYLHVAPPNIEIRRQIREAGIDLLRKLHESGDYDRIVLVGHSLGSVIGYDILTHYWVRCNDAHATKEREVTPSPALLELEKLARDFQGVPPGYKAYQAAQSAYLKELQSQGCPWLVTDFVTLGSPLTHAPVLMARNEEQLKDKKAEREFPTCPPELEFENGEGRFSFGKRVDGKIFRVPHHAAVFGPTRWTNLYFPCSWTIKGDVIGGPIESSFGLGIRDIKVETSLRSGLLSHTLYWSFPKRETAETPTWITSLREAIKVCETPPAASQTPKGDSSLTAGTKK